MAVLTPIVLLVQLLAEVVAVKLMWGWFIAQPLGVPEIGYATALGITLLVGILTVRMPDFKNKPTSQERLIASGSMTGAILVSLGIGYLVHTFL